MKQSLRKKAVIISFFVFIIPEIIILLLPVLIYILPFVQLNYVNKFYTVLLAKILVIFVSSVFVKRAYCSHLCPITGFLTLIKFQNTFIFPKLYGYSMFILWVSPAIFINCLIIVNMNMGIIVPKQYLLTSVRLFYNLMLITAILSRTYGKTDQAHYNCIYGPLMITAIKLSKQLRFKGLVVQLDKSKCKLCGVCVKQCPANLKMKEELIVDVTNHYKCIQCGNCVESCSSGAIKRKCEVI